MISISDTCKEFNKAMGLKGRFLLFVLAPFKEWCDALVDGGLLDD